LVSGSRDRFWRNEKKKENLIIRYKRNKNVRFSMRRWNQSAQANAFFFCMRIERYIIVSCCKQSSAGCSVIYGQTSTYNILLLNSFSQKFLSVAFRDPGYYYSTRTYILLLLLLLLYYKIGCAQKTYDVRRSMINNDDSIIQVVYA